MSNNTWAYLVPLLLETIFRNVHTISLHSRMWCPLLSDLLSVVGCHDSWVSINREESTLFWAITQKISARVKYMFSRFQKMIGILGQHDDCINLNTYWSLRDQLFKFVFLVFCIEPPKKWALSREYLNYGSILTLRWSIFAKFNHVRDYRSFVSSLNHI